MAEVSEQGRERFAALHEVRDLTDQKLAREREDADRELEEKTAAAKRKTEETVQRAHAEVDRSLQSTAAEATRSAGTATAETTELREALQVPGAPPRGEVAEKAQQASAAESKKAQQVVATVAERAGEEIAIERERIHEATESERRERKRAFLEILAHERGETDAALGTERKRSDLLVATRDEVMSLISHDLRNLIQVLQLKTGLLLRALPADAPDPARKLAQEIANSCKIMSRWTSDLVDISSLDTGVLRLVPAAWRRAELVNEAVTASLAKATEKGLDVSIHVEGPERLVRCDRDRIVQVLMKLLDNAIKFTPRSGAVTVGVDGLDRQVRFYVTDTGPGLSEKDHEAVFERRSHATSQRGVGAGLGLYLAKRVVEAHGGRIWFESEPGRATTFSFVLPDRLPS